MTSLMAGSLRFVVSLILVGVLLDFHHKHNLEDIFSWLRKHLFISILIRVLKYQEWIFKTIGSIFLYKRYYNIPWPTLQKKLPLRSHMMLQRTFVWYLLFLPYLPHALFVIRRASSHSLETGLGWLCWVKTKWGRVLVFLCSLASCRLILMLCLALRTLLPTQGTSQGTVSAGNWFFWGVSCCVKIDTRCLSNPSVSLVGGGGVRQDTKVT